MKAAEVIAALPPETWDATVWVPGDNYITGRVDGADVLRIVEAVLAKRSLEPLEAE